MTDFEVPVLSSEEISAKMTEGTVRKTVPWNIMDVFLIMILFVLMPSVGVLVYKSIPYTSRLDILIQPPKESSITSSTVYLCPVSRNKYQSEDDEVVSHNSSKQEMTTEEKELAKSHPLNELLIRSKQTDLYVLVLILTILTGVIAAPVTEEFVFRVVFQGALEKYIPSKEAGWGNRFLMTVLAIGIPAFVFGSIHYRDPSQVRALDTMFIAVMVIPFAHLITLLLGIFWLIMVRGATWSDLGLSIQNTTDYIKDIFTGIKTFIIIAPFIYGLQILLSFLFPNIVTDPVTIFFFAICLGFVYWKKHRFMSIITMHVSLNGLSFVLLFLSSMATIAS